MMVAIPQRRLRLHRIAVAEMRGEPATRGSLHRRGSIRLRSRSQRLQARLVTLLQALLALKLTILGLEQALLRALRPRAFRLPRLQLLHASLQAIDAALPIGAFA